jgi:hypothetical protein
MLSWDYRINQIDMFLDLPDPDPIVRGMEPDPAPDPSITCKNSKKNLDYYFVTLFNFLSLKNEVNVPSKSNKQKKLKIKKLFFCWHLKVSDENSRIRIRIQIY